MGKRGPRPTPTELRVVRGDRPDRINHDTPTPPSSDVIRPDWLSDQAAEVWDRLAPDLQRKGLLTSWDVDSFAVLCDAIVQYRAASKLVTQAGVMIKGRKDAVVKNPAMQLVRDSSQTIRAFAQEFGMTPSARSEITSPSRRGSHADDLLTG